MKPLSRLYLYVLFVLITSVIFPGIAHPQDDEIDADRPDAALKAMVALPLASEVFKPDDPKPQFNLGFANELSEKMDLTYHLGYGWTGGDPVRSYGANITREFIEGLTLYLEIFGSKGRGETAEHQADIGLLYLMLPNLQFDVAAGRRLNKAAPHSFITSGLALRLPR